MSMVLWLLLLSMVLLVVLIRLISVVLGTQLDIRLLLCVALLGRWGLQLGCK